MGTTLTGTISRSGISVTGKITPDPKLFEFLEDGTQITLGLDEIRSYLNQPLENLTGDDVETLGWIKSNPRLQESLKLTSRNLVVTRVR